MENKYLDQALKNKFLKALFFELQIVFKDLKPEDDDIPLISGSFGWKRAFYETCKKNKMLDVLKWYESLPWYDSDEVDDIIVTKMLTVIRKKA